MTPPRTSQPTDQRRTGSRTSLPPHLLHFILVRLFLLAEVDLLHLGWPVAAAAVAPGVDGELAGSSGGRLAVVPLLPWLLQLLRHRGYIYVATVLSHQRG
jgi:hypothetical protein